MKVEDDNGSTSDVGVDDMMSPTAVLPAVIGPPTDAGVGCNISSNESRYRSPPPAPACCSSSDEDDFEDEKKLCWLEGGLFILLLSIMFVFWCFS